MTELEKALLYQRLCPIKRWEDEYHKTNNIEELKELFRERINKNDINDNGNGS